MKPESLFIGARILDPSGVPITVTFDFFKTASKEYIEECSEISLDEKMVAKMAFDNPHIKIKPFSKIESIFALSYDDVIIAIWLTTLTELQLICKALGTTVKNDKLEL